jgi:U3 small nucleolar RNA-associated protein 23
MHFVPIIYIMGQVPILEEPASMAKGNAKEKESSGLQPTQWEKKVLSLVKEDPLTLPVKHKRKRREPNPLSCKKKRKISALVPAQELPDEKQKKTRRKSRKTKEKSASITESQNSS